MKKIFFILMILCILLFLPAAFAADLPEGCPLCGNTDMRWSNVIDWDGNDCHVLCCESCGVAVGDYEVCTPDEGTATCSMPTLCAICGYPMFSTTSVDPDKHDLTETEYWWNFIEFDENNLAVYRCSARIRCNQCTYSETLSVIASYEITTPPTCVEDGVLTYTAVFDEEWAGTVSNDQLADVPPVGHTYVYTEALAPTCTEDGLTEGIHCSVCGTVTKVQKVVPALGHQYKKTTVKPTCTKEGSVISACEKCGDSHVIETIPARKHFYALWEPSGDGRHSAPCRRCTYVHTKDCTFFEVTVNDGKTVLSICPVCGRAGNDVYEVIQGAAITSATRKALPGGEAIVRGMAAPFDGVLYAFTAAYEYAGSVVPYGTSVSVSLPLDAAQYPAFDLLRADVTAASETAERTEVRTAVPYTFENNVLTFEADAAAVYLLIAK